MLTDDFVYYYRPCVEGAHWAYSVSRYMADVWDALIREKKLGWLLWVASQEGILMRNRLSYRLLRESPMPDGRTLWELLPYSWREQLCVRELLPYSWEEQLCVRELISDVKLAEQQYLKANDVTPWPSAYLSRRKRTKEDVAMYQAIQAAWSLVDHHLFGIVRGSANAACALAGVAYLDYDSDLNDYEDLDEAPKEVLTTHFRILHEMGNPFKKEKPK